VETRDPNRREPPERPPPPEGGLGPILTTAIVFFGTVIAIVLIGIAVLSSMSSSCGYR
jgi:hypothetical protein